MKLLMIILSLSLFSSSLQAKTHVKQKPLKYKDSQAVFPNVLAAHYEVEYDVRTKKASATSSFIFNLEENGYPVLDLVPEALEVLVNDTTASLKEVEIRGVTKIKVITKKLAKGEHIVQIKNTFDRLVKFQSNSVSSAFWMSDLSDRQYLEQYLPAPLEYDQFKVTMDVKIKGANSKHVIFTNGKIKEIANNHFKISYPKYYTASSIFYHLVPTGSYSLTEANYKSIDGRTIPITVYSKSNLLSINSFKTNALKFMKVLEEDYGPWPHDAFLVNAVGPFNGGMEYAGATWTSLRALRHEMDHSYFARNIMPGRGNAGWIDEAIASWGDDNYQQTSSPKVTGVASHSPYRRTTDRNAYGPGSKLLGFLDNKFESKGGLKKFLKDYFERNQRSVISNEFFKKEMEDFFNVDLTQFFNKYIYSKNLKMFKSRLNYVEKVQNPYHRQFTEKELRKFL